MVRVRYTDGGTYRVAGESFEEGDEADVSDGLAEHLVDDIGAFEYVDGGSDAGDDGEAEPEIAPHELTLDELEDALAGVDDLYVLHSVESAEEDGKDRAGAYDLIDERREELEG